MSRQHKRSREYQGEHEHEHDYEDSFVVSDNDENDENGSDDEYSQPQLAPILANALSELLKQPKEDLLPVVKTAFRRLDLSANPIASKHGEEYLRLSEQLEQDQPQLDDILTSRLTESDKKECLMLWKHWQTLPPNTKEWWQTSQEIRNILINNQHESLERALFLEQEEKRLTALTTNYSDLKTKILDLKAPDDVKANLLSMYRTMLSYPEDSSFRSSLREEIEWSIRLPYEERVADPHVGLNNSKLNQFYCRVRQELDRELYGMEEVKQKLLHILNDRRSSGDSCGRNLLLCGPPGTGKTQIGKVLARVLGKKFTKISAAGLDSAAIKGSNKVYVGSEPSIFLQSLAAVGSNNPVVMIDEAEKMDAKAQQAMIHVSDPSDNMNFQDGYLKNGYHDLSRILFICNTNSVESMDPAFLDRFDVLYLSGYNQDEQEIIFEKYMLPKALEAVGLAANSVTVEGEAIKKFLVEYSHPGLRTLERKIKNLVGRINMYNSVVLKGGKTGKLDLGYHIPNFRLPIKIDYHLLCELTQ